MRVATLLLAAFLWVSPLCRAGADGGFFTPPRMAIFQAWTADALAAVGAYDALSGASAAVSGVVKYVGTTPVGFPTNHVVEPVDQPFKYRITVSNPGVDIAQNYFNCLPLPPGLTINTNPGAAGYITGTPTSVGIYAVTLVAGNLNYATPATLPATFVFYLPNAPPQILQQPASKSVLVGSNATFRVGAAGALPLGYEWWRSGAALPGRSAEVLTITNASTRDAGDYQVVVTNAFGATTSVVARLTVREPFLAQLTLGSPSSSNDLFRFQVTGPIQTNYVIWGSPDASTWTPLQTNWVLDGILDFTDPIPGGRPSRLYRATIAP